jgi:RND family efflux transporter MFP subunit
MSTSPAPHPRLGLAILLVAGAAVLPACQAAQAAAPVALAPTAIAVRTVPIERTGAELPIRATGVVVAKEQASLGFKVGGVIARVLVQPGQVVTAGQLLATLDTREIDAQVRQAEVALEKARRDSERAQKLYAGSAATLQVTEDAASAVHVAEQNVAIAHFNRDHAVIVAAGPGRVARRLAEPNTVVGPGTPVVQVNMASAGYVVRAGLIDRDFVRVKPGATADVLLDAYPGRRFKARVIEVAEEPSPVSGVYDVELRLEGPPPRLASGLVAKVELRPAAADPLPIVPIEALVEGDGSSATVFTVTTKGTAHRVPVVLAFLSGGTAAIRTGLEGVERIVTDGAPYLTEGAVVREVAP